MKTCAKCGKTTGSIWYFCKKCQLFLCYSCAANWWGLLPCPTCKSDKNLVKVQG